MNLGKVHIAFVMPWHISERGGGAEVQANYLSQELANRGFQVSYICQTTNENKINSKKTIGNVTVYWLKPSGRFQWQDQNKYLKPLKKIKPDYILQRLSSNVTYVLGKYRSKNNCKFIWFCTDNKSPYNNFQFSKFKERSTIKSLGLLKYSVFALSNKIMDYYRNRGMNYVDIAFHQNNIQKTLMKKHFNLDSCIMISGHPIPSQQIAISKRFKNQTILWCANFGQHKRPELFIELASKMQHTNFKFVMVGGHSNKAYISKLLNNKPDNLDVIGQLSFDESLKFFDNASILINSSEAEGFSNTYIQAWLRGVPTLVFGADPDNVIVNNNLGNSVKNVEQAVQYLEKTLNDNEAYRMVSDNAYNYAIKNHSIKKMTDNFLNKINH